MEKKPNTKDLEKDIVSFEQAKELHSIGLDTTTLCGYDIETGELYTCRNYKSTGLYKPDKDLYAPTKSQVFRWFRGVGVYSNIGRYYDEEQGEYYYYNIEDSYRNKKYLEEDFDTYEEAEDIAINKLIELVKEDKE